MARPLSVSATSTITGLVLAAISMSAAPAAQGLDGEDNAPASSTSAESRPESPQERVPVAPTPRKRFATAAGELTLLNAGLWGFNRYVTKQDYAFISLETVKANLKSGFHFDPDNFTVNQSGHPYQGSLSFAAARSNGYTYWESGAFALVGSLVWECCLENSRPSTNDVVNTTLGGMTRGEISHRLATMLRDNTATGGSRVWREIGGALIDPVSGFTRLVKGDVARDFPNPAGRLPIGFDLTGDAGFRQVGGEHPNQRLVSVNGSYGDPFGGDIEHPFDSFWVGIDVNSSNRAAISRMEERGLLAGWALGASSARVHHIVGLSQEYQYFNNAAQVFGAEIFGAMLLSRYPLGSSFEARTDVGVMLFPLAGIRTTDFENPQTGRDYDYGTGGGVRVGGRVLRAGREIGAAEYRVASAHTVNGTSDRNTLQYVTTSLRIPLVARVGVGAGYSWYSRQTTYSRFPDARQTQREWRVFADVALAERHQQR